ncbi:MAG TPA: hypothetical protein V6D26_23575 [Stenomitos sp.]
MYWKCPQCGADDNEESSRRCVCGYEPDERTLLTLEWVEPSPKPEISPRSPDRPKTKKQKLGEALYITPIVGLLIPLVLILTNSWNPSKRQILAIGSAGFFISTVSSLLTDDIGIRGVGAVKRIDNPKQYWTQFVVQTFLTVLLLIFALFVNE